MTQQEPDESHFFNIVEEIDEEGNILNSRLEKIEADDQLKKKLDSAKTQSQSEEDFSNDKGKLSYNKGFLNNKSTKQDNSEKQQQRQNSKNESEISGRQSTEAKVLLDEDYTDDGSEFAELLKDMVIEDKSINGDSKFEKKVEEIKEDTTKGTFNGGLPKDSKPESNQHTTVPTKANGGQKMNLDNSEGLDAINKLGSEVQSELEAISQKSPSIDKIRKLKQKNTSSLFIRNTKRTLKKRAEQKKKKHSNQDIKSEAKENKSEVAHQKVPENKVKFDSKESNIGILPAEKVIPLAPRLRTSAFGKNIENGKQKVNTETKKEEAEKDRLEKESEESQSFEKNSKRQPQGGKESFDQIQNNKSGTVSRPQITQEDMYELEFMSDAFAQDDGEDDEVEGLEGKDGNEQLIDDNFDEEELYKRIFPWITAKSQEQDDKGKEKKSGTVNNDVDQFKNINGLYDDGDDDDELAAPGDFVFEKPIISQEILDAVKGNLVYDIDNEPIKEIMNNEISHNVEYVETAHEPVVESQSKLKSNLKAQEISNSNIVSSPIETKSDAVKKEKKSVSFAPKVQVKEVENISEDLKQKLELDKMYKEIFGDDYQKMQDQISSNMAQFGKVSPISTSLPESGIISLNPDVVAIEDSVVKGSQEGDEKITNGEEMDDLTFNDIVSNRIVENKVIDTAFGDIDEKNTGNETFTNTSVSASITLSNGDVDYATRQNTRKNRNKISRFKQSKLNNEIF